MTYSDVGGCKEQIEKLREVVETPLLHVCIPCYKRQYMCSSLLYSSLCNLESQLGLCTEVRQAVGLQ